MTLLHRFESDISVVEAPQRFNNPFYYQPHALCAMAADEVRAMLMRDNAVAADVARGKMLGVLVVRDCDGGLGYLAAFSGLLVGRNNVDGFVPPVFDLQLPGGYFKQEEARISVINARIRSIGQSETFLAATAALHSAENRAEELVRQMSAQFRANKEERRKMREAGSLSADDMERLTRQSQYEKAELKRLKRKWESVVAEKREALSVMETEIAALRAERHARSVSLQRWLFEQFKVLNAKGVPKSLLDIFEERLSALPPAGAGECAGPKLLQYAYSNNLQPLAMAEFWVGESPVGEVRRDGCFYGACKSKCEPILGYMLQGLDVEESALETGGAIENLGIVYEDEYLIVVDKPSGVLSVPGVVGGVSVQQWLREEYLHSNNLFVVHRLDMATSGLLVAAKSIEVYKALQKQFAERKVEKHYMALLDGVPAENDGVVDLPLAPDYMNRPRQTVDRKNGKEARTFYEVTGNIMYKDRECAVVRFTPVTGRTHQLRVHAASKDGLDCPIVGDALYGAVDARLMLHASSLEFYHPVTGKTVAVESPAQFLSES